MSYIAFAEVVCKSEADGVFSDSVPSFSLNCATMFSGWSVATRLVSGAGRKYQDNQSCHENGTEQHLCPALPVQTHWLKMVIELSLTWATCMLKRQRQKQWQIMLKISCHWPDQLVCWKDHNYIGHQVLNGFRWNCILCVDAKVRVSKKFHHPAGSSLP